MRRRLPTDAAICLVLALLISYGVGALAGRISDRSFERKKEELAPISGEIGAEADDAVYRAGSVEDMLSHDTFTIEIPSDNALSQARGYHNGIVLSLITLPSGESIGASINYENIRYEEDDPIYGGGSVILPIGRVVYDDLSDDEYLLTSIEHGKSLSRKDFYVDMAGAGLMESKDETTNTNKLMAQLITIMILYPIFHALGTKFGLWGGYFTKRNKSEWE